MKINIEFFEFDKKIEIISFPPKNLSNLKSPFFRFFSLLKIKNIFFVDLRCELMILKSKTQKKYIKISNKLDSALKKKKNKTKLKKKNF
jgi:hypothetical protein